MGCDLSSKRPGMVAQTLTFDKLKRDKIHWGDWNPDSYTKLPETKAAVDDWQLKLGVTDRGKTELDQNQNIWKTKLEHSILTHCLHARIILVPNGQRKQINFTPSGLATFHTQHSQATTVLSNIRCYVRFYVAPISICNLHLQSESTAFIIVLKSQVMLPAYHPINMFI